MPGKTEFPLALVIKAVDKATGPLRRINEKIAETTAIPRLQFRVLGNSIKALSDEAGLPRIGKALSNVGSASRKVGSEVMKLGGLFKGAVVTALFGGFGIYSLAKGAIDAGDKLGEMAQRTGLGVDAFASLQFAAGQADVDQEQFNNSMDQFNKRLGEAKAGGGPLLAFLNKVSPALAKQVKGVKSTEEGLSLMTDAFSRIEDPQRRAALAAAVFGKSGLQMGQFLGQGSEAIQKLQAEYIKLVGPQQDFVDGAGALDNEMKKTEVAFLGLRNAAAGALFPALTGLAKAVTDIVAGNREGLKTWAEDAGAAISKWVKDGKLKELVTDIKDVATSAGAAIDKVGGLGNALGIVAAIMAGPTLVATAQLALSFGTMGVQAAFAAGKIVAALIPSLISGAAAAWAFAVPFLIAQLPIIALTAAIVGLAAAGYQVYKNWDALKGLFSDFWQTISFHAERAWEKISPIIGALRGALSSKMGNILTLGLGGAIGPGAARSAAASAPGGNNSTSSANLAVSFANLPRGAQVSQSSQGFASFDVSRGYSLASAQ